MLAKLSRHTVVIYVYYANVSYALQDECLIPILQALKFSMQNQKAQNGPGDKVAYM